MKNPIILFLFLLIPLLALASGSPLLYRVAYLLAFLVLLAYLWTRWSIGQTEAQVERLTPQPQAGQWLEEKVEIRNYGWLPKFFLEVRHKTDLPGHYNYRVVHVLPHHSTTWVTRNLCQRRGLFAYGAVQVVSQDPFGLFSRRHTLGREGSIMVYPATLELSDFLLPAGKILGEGYYRGRLERASPEAAGVREYRPGDSFSRIHWRSTARTGELMVKELEREPSGPSGEVWIILDLQAAAQAGVGMESTEEYGVTIAASIAKKYVDTIRAVGLVAWGDKPYMLPAQRGTQQWGLLLEALALVQARGQAPLAEVVSAALGRMDPAATALVITPASQETLREPFRRLGERGVRTVAILLDAASFGGPGNARLTLDWLVSGGITAYIVRRGEEIAKALDSRVQGWASKYRPVPVG